MQDLRGLPKWLVYREDIVTDSRLPRELSLPHWAAMLDLPIRAHNCLEDMGYESLGDVADGFGEHLLDQPEFGARSFRAIADAILASGYAVSCDIPEETWEERDTRERQELYDATTRRRREAVFDAAADGSRTLSDIARHMGIRPHVAATDYQRERLRRFREWWFENPAVPLTDVPLQLRPDLSRRVLRELTGHGVATHFGARDLRRNRALDGISLTCADESRLLGALDYRPHRFAPRREWSRPAREQSRVVHLPATRGAQAALAVDTES